MVQKVKAKDLSDNWVFGLLTKKDGEYYILNNNRNLVKIKQETIGSALIKIDNKWLYEGDIIFFPYTYIYGEAIPIYGIVKYDADKGKTYLETDNSYLKRLDFEDSQVRRNYVFDGNIHDDIALRAMIEGVEPKTKDERQFTIDMDNYLKEIFKEEGLL